MYFWPPSGRRRLGKDPQQSPCRGEKVDRGGTVRDERGLDPQALEQFRLQGRESENPSLSQKAHLLATFHTLRGQQSPALRCPLTPLPRPFAKEPPPAVPPNLPSCSFSPASPARPQRCRGWCWPPAPGSQPQISSLQRQPKLQPGPRPGQPEPWRSPGPVPELLQGVAVLRPGRIDRERGSEGWGSCGSW